MTTRKKQAATGLNTYKIAAAIAQVLSFGATYLLAAAIFGQGLNAFGAALAFEFVLMKGKQLVFSGDNPSDPTGWSCIIADTVINGAGMFAGVLQFDQTEVWTMLQQSLELKGEMGGIPALVISLVLGFVLSIAPHSLWRD